LKSCFSFYYFYHLYSTSILDVCSGLIAVCKLVTEDMIPAVIGDVLTALKHESELVRKKAIAAIHRFHQMDKRVVHDHLDKIRRALCDKDPSVMAGTLPLFQDMIKEDVMLFKDLVPSFVVILKQIVEHRLPREFDYHRIPSPWIQMNLLRILALLGRGDQASSEGMYEILIEVMKRADTGINVGYAVGK
jgi:AP-4 complex subunit epsilon-1